MARRKNSGKKNLPANNVYNKKKPKIKVTIINKEIISKTVQIPESESSLGGSSLIRFINITKRIEVKERKKKRVFLIDQILPFQILKLELKSKRYDSE